VAYLRVVLQRPLRYLAITLSLIVAAGFVAFAFDDFSRASSKTQGRISGYEVTDPTPAGERERERRHSKARELVDDANDIVLRPFAGIVSDTNRSRWVERGVPAMLALLVYGFGIGYLSRFAHGRG
jgi:hypothetical protein